MTMFNHLPQQNGSVNEYSFFLTLEHQRQQAEVHHRNARMLREISLSTERPSCGELLFGKVKRTPGMVSFGATIRRWLWRVARNVRTRHASPLLKRKI